MKIAKCDKNSRLFEMTKWPDSLENFIEAAEHRAELFRGNTGQHTGQTDVDPVRRDVIGVWRHKPRQRLEEDCIHLRARVVEHSTEDLRYLLDFWRTVASPNTSYVNCWYNNF